MRLCYYLYYYEILICIIKEVRIDEGGELQVYIDQGCGGVGRQGGGSNYL